MIANTGSPDCAPWWRCTVLAAALLVSSAPAHTVSLPASLGDNSAPVTTVKTGLQAPEGPACDSSGTLLFCDYGNRASGAGVIWRVPTGGTATKFLQSLTVPCGLAFDSQNRLIICESQKVSRLEPSGSTTVLAGGAGIKLANDLVVTQSGIIFFTGNEWDAESYVYAVTPAGQVAKILTFPGSPDAGFPNGIEYDDATGALYVCLSQKNVVRKYRVTNQVNAGSPVDFAALNNPDGIVLDVNGNVWVAEFGRSRVVVFDSTGKQLGFIAIDASNLTNLTFGGPDRQTLYMTAGSAVYSLRLKARGKLPTTGISARHGLRPAKANGARSSGIRLGPAIRTAGPAGSAAAAPPMTLSGRLLQPPVPPAGGVTIEGESGN